MSIVVITGWYAILPFFHRTCRRRGVRGRRDRAGGKNVPLRDARTARDATIAVSPTRIRRIGT